MKQGPAERERGFFDCYERALALGSRDALGLVAYCLSLGGKQYGVAQNLTRAVELAQLGVTMQPPEPVCLAVLGWSYLHGEAGLAKDVDRGLKLLQEGVDQGHDVAMHYLGWYYQGTVKDFSRALPLMHRASELGNSLAMNNLGFHYQFEAKPLQLDRALKLYQQAAELGLPSAMNNLAIYFTECSNPPQLERARQFFQQAASLGHSTAIQTLKKAPFA